MDRINCAVRGVYWVLLLLEKANIDSWLTPLRGSLAWLDRLHPGELRELSCSAQLFSETQAFFDNPSGKN